MGQLAHQDNAQGMTGNAILALQELIVPQIPVEIAVPQLEVSIVVPEAAEVVAAAQQDALQIIPGNAVQNAMQLPQVEIMPALNAHNLTILAKTCQYWDQSIEPFSGLIL